MFVIFLCKKNRKSNICRNCRKKIENTIHAQLHVTTAFTFFFFFFLAFFVCAPCLTLPWLILKAIMLPNFCTFSMCSFAPKKSSRMLHSYLRILFHWFIKLYLMKMSCTAIITGSNSGGNFCSLAHIKHDAHQSPPLRKKRELFQPFLKALREV